MLTGYKGKFHWKQIWGASRYKRFRHINRSPIHKSHLFEMLGDIKNKRRVILNWKKRYGLVEKPNKMFDFWDKQPNDSELLKTVLIASLEDLGV